VEFTFCHTYIKLILILNVEYEKDGNVRKVCVKYQNAKEKVA